MTDGCPDVDLGDRIGKLVQDEYQKLGSASKPVTRSNGLKEWTILAGIVAVSVDKPSRKSKLRLISIGTGVKALPDAVLSRSQGRMVHDCHAEILALRGFNTVLLEHASYMEKDPRHRSDLIERNASGAYALKNEWELALYISALPCGDASMNLLNETESHEDIKFCIQEDSEIQWVDERVRTIVRGRFNYGKLGVVRTKPGRYDSQITYSKSCSDKLCASQATSVLNSLTWELMEHPVFLKYLVIPNETNYEDLYRSFRDRLRDVPLHRLEFLTCTKSFSDGKTNSNSEPSSMSCIKLFIELPDATNVEQAILNGVRNGFYTKGSKPLRKNCEPIVSRLAQWRLFTKIRPELNKTSYLAFKASQDTRNTLICDTREQLSPDGWIKTSEDDCQL